MKRVLKWIGIALGSVLVLALVALAALYAISGSKLATRKAIAAEPPLTIPSDSATIARGAHLVRALPCGSCHGADLGGAVIADAGPFGLLVGPNLTRGRGGRQPPLTDVEWERAIRHGVRRDSTSLMVMPSDVFHAIADVDMAPMIAYLKQIPAVDRDVPPTKLRIVGRVVLGLGQVPLAADTTPRTAHVAAVDTTPGALYGRYLVSISGCQGCHGASFSGGPGFTPDEPPVSNITPTGIGHYTEADFIRAMREGVRPAGTQLIETMPWKFIGKLSDSELRSIWQFLLTLPPKQFQER
ncbi:MAG: c-type cytochrome [Gemmatimonadaceae bacterium]